MKDNTQIFMEDNESDAQARRLNEFKDLAKHIKERIYELMMMGDDEEALAVIYQLQSVTPDDNELKELKKRIDIK